MNLTPLKYLLFIENFTCIFRNYLCLKRCTRIFAVCWVLFELCNLLVNSICNYSHVHLKTQSIYLYSVSAFSVYIMLSALYFSRTFYDLLVNFEAFYHIFNDKIYNQKMKTAQIVLSTLVVTFCTLKIVLFTLVQVLTTEKNIGLMGSTISQYNLSWCDFRYIYQYFFLYSILFIISEQVQTVKRSIDGELSESMLKHKKMISVEDMWSASAVQNRLNKINQWVQAQENLNVTSQLCNPMFNIQLSIMLLIVTAYYIILLYSIALSTVKGVQTVSLLMNLFSMVVFLSALLVISHAGQQVQNGARQLRRKLCKLCIYSLENEQCYKVTKDLLRSVRTRPVRVHVFGSLNVNMSLLPSVVAFFTSYTVISLQLNNVL